MSDATPWMGRTELAESRGVLPNTIENRVRTGAIYGGERYEKRDVTADDEVHHATRWLYRAVPHREPRSQEIVMTEATPWMPCKELAELEGVSHGTIRNRLDSGAVTNGRRYEERARCADDDCHHTVQTLFRSVPVTTEVVEKKPTMTPAQRAAANDANRDAAWQQKRRAAAEDRIAQLEHELVIVRGELDDLEERYRNALEEKNAAVEAARQARDARGGAALVDAMLSALGDTDPRDAREILADALREHLRGASW